MTTMMEADYTWAGQLRWNLWFANPNHAGAFVALLIPWAWALGAGFPRAERGAARVAAPLVVALLVELPLWWILCMTYSRGALLAALMALGLFAILVAVRESGECAGRAWRRAAGRVVPRLAVLAILMLGNGFWSRVDPAFVSGDASAGNRLTLWAHGLRMIAASPWHGWGGGEAGHAYMQFFQPLADNEAYRTMVNSWLTLAVERGLPVLVGIVFATLLLLHALCLRARRGPGWTGLLASAAASSILAFCVCHSFSTLWVIPELWLAVAPAAIVGLWSGISLARRRPGQFMGIAAIALGLPSLGAIALIPAARSIPSDHQVRVDSGAIVMERPLPEAPRSRDGLRLAVLPDEDVIGPSFGRELRRLLIAASTVRSVTTGPDARADLTVLMGGRARLASGVPGAVVLVHPSGSPDGIDWSRVSAILLPDLDFSGSRDDWREAAHAHGIPAFTSPGVATDIRAAWPDAILPVLAAAPDNPRPPHFR